MKKAFAVMGILLLSAGLFAREVTVSIGAGKNWKEKMASQCAVWLEDANGNYVRTLYVTQRASKRNWIVGPKTGRPESLPVWYHAAKYESAKGAPGNADVDAVTAATPKGGVVFTAEIGDGTYVIKAEFNTSFDYNDFYTKKNSGVNGQPAVVYKAKIPADTSGEIELTLAGTGSEDGSDGKIYTDVSHLTTAKTIVDKIIIKMK
ncbi:DUF2271 domain-containing protein [Treponema socranskii]|uniref:DUF2271 domain-containing protein n=1 Tax=Treponema socranskii TaxID=53419 RepID=UPI003D8AD538